MPPEYLNFDLLLDLAPQVSEVRARVLYSPGGEAVTTFSLATIAEGLSRAGISMPVNLLIEGSESIVANAATIPTAFDHRVVGSHLSAAVLGGAVGSCLRRSLEEARRREVGLRIRLRFAEEVSGLASLPWELLCDPDAGSFLALSELTPVIRYAELGHPPQSLRVQLPLTLLVVVATPQGLDALEVDREWRTLQEALRPLEDRSVVVVERLSNASLFDLQERLRGGPVHVLHFIGHGYFDPAHAANGLIFEDTAGNPELVTGETLGMVLLGASSLRLVFLNACQTDQVYGRDSFAGVAQQLVQQGTPAVIAIRSALSDRAANVLSGAFYRALADGLPADTALSHARTTVAVSVAGDEWATPVLYSRSDDNRLFDLVDVLPAPLCPYPGMAPFQTRDVRFFFGRESEITQMLRHLSEHRLLLLMGPSGAGKSSLLMAGLLPRLETSSLFASGDWCIRWIRLGGEPHTALQTAMEGDLTQPEQDVTRLLASNPPAKRLLLVVDQAEELFSLADFEQRQAFIRAFQSLQAVQTCTMVLAFRANFYSDLIESDLWPIDAGQRIEITTLRGDALRKAIREPAAQVGVTIEEALIERLVADAAGEPGALPMLQETLRYLWDSLHRRHLALDAYIQLGDGDGGALGIAIRIRADAAYLELSVEERRIAKRIFLRLVQFGQRPEHTRRQLPESQLHSSDDDPEVFTRVISHLADRRLLTLSGGEAGSERLVDLSHELLITIWPKLAAWVAEHHEMESARRRLEAKAQEWVRMGRSEGGLLDKDEISEAKAYCSSTSAVELGVSSDLQELIRVSDPGFNRLGVIVFFLAVFSIAALGAWAYMMLQISGLQGIALAAVETAFFFFASISIGVSFWLLVRSGRFALQHLSQKIRKQRSYQVVIGAVASAAVVAWVGTGVSILLTAMMCAQYGIDWTGQSVGLAVVNEDADPKEATFFALSLKNAATLEKVEVMLVEPGVADQCAQFFSHRIALKSQTDSTQTESIYTAEITPVLSNQGVLLRAGEGCGEVFMLAHDVAIALGYSNRAASSCRAPAPAACGPWIENEKAYALYRERRFSESVVRYEQLVHQFPEFAWARHNLGMAQMEACQDPAVVVKELQSAVTLADGSCGWFWYDLALACRLTKDYACAMEAAEQALYYDSTLVDAYNAMGVFLMEMGRLEESAQRFDEFAAHLNNRANASQRIVLEKNLGILAYHQGQFATAVQRLEEARNRVQMQRSINQSVVRYEEEIVFYLGRSYEALGDANKACELFLQYQEIAQQCMAGESERRAYVVSRVQSALCSQP